MLTTVTTRFHLWEKKKVNTVHAQHPDMHSSLAPPKELQTMVIFAAHLTASQTAHAM